MSEFLEVGGLLADEGADVLAVIVDEGVDGKGGVHDIGREYELFAGLVWFGLVCLLLLFGLLCLLL